MTVRDHNSIFFHFPECKVLLCDFHREQAWERWLKTTANGAVNQKGTILQATRNIANALTVEKMNAAIRGLRELPELLHEKSLKLRTWFETKWMPQIKEGIHRVTKKKFTSSQGFPTLHQALHH